MSKLTNDWLNFTDETSENEKGDDMVPEYSAAYEALPRSIYPRAAAEEMRQIVTRFDESGEECVRIVPERTRTLTQLRGAVRYAIKTLGLTDRLSVAVRGDAVYIVRGGE